jgi:hypothetical protein
MSADVGADITSDTSNVLPSTRRSMAWTVLRRSAMSAPSASWMRLSLSESSELVAPSSTRIGVESTVGVGATLTACLPAWG